MKILVAVPTFETIYPDTYKSVYELDDGGHELSFDFVRGYDCATARNSIAQKALNTGAYYVLMVDNDVVLPKDALVNLLEGCYDIVLGYYAHRNPDNRYNGNTSVCRRFAPDGSEYFNYPRDSEYTAAEMAQAREQGDTKIRIHGGGMGCALIRTAIFKRLPYPWFDWVNYADERRGMLSEDLYFCEQCKSHRIPVYTDTRVGCGHMFRYVQWPTTE